MPWGSLIGIVFFSLCAAFFAGIETGIYVTNRIRLQFKAYAGDRFARTASNLIKDSQNTITATLIGTNLGVFFATLICTRLCMKSFGHYAELVSTAILSPILFVFAEVIPKNAFTRASDRLFYPLSPLLSASKTVFMPAIVLFGAITRAIARMFGITLEKKESPFTREKFESFILEGSEEGIISEYQNLMAKNILEINNLKVTSSFIGLSKCVMAERSSMAEDIYELARASKYTRIPVFEKERTNIIGIINIFDLYLGGGKEKVPEEVLREAVHLSTELDVAAAFLELRRKRNPMGIVVDEDKKAVGIITLKDIVEEIVGELSVW